MLKYPFKDTQKTPTKHVLRLLKKFVKIRFSAQTFQFSAQISNYAKIPRETLKKHQLNMFWGF